MLKIGCSADQHVQVALNPGDAPEDTAYYGIADLLLTAEDFFDDFR